MTFTTIFLTNFEHYPHRNMWRSSAPVTEETRHRGLHKGPSEGTKPTPVRDHQGAATPPADRAYLRDLSHVHILVACKHTHIHAYLYCRFHTRKRFECTERRKVVDPGGHAAQWRSSDSPRLVHASFPCETGTGYEKGQRYGRTKKQCRQHNRRVSTKICPVQISTPTRLDKSSPLTALGLPGFQGRDDLLAYTRSVRGTFRARFLSFFLCLMTWETNAINHLAL